ncbi:reverse transcriptase, partial [Plakobranchus ocellatus]
MIAVPEITFAAMENWGLVISHEKVMFYYEGDTDARFKEIVAFVTSHEIAHKWFGNLATLAWWDDTWLNEGFASFMQNMAVDFVHPEWNYFDAFAKSFLHPVFSPDSKKSSRPVYAPVNKPYEIQAMFEMITYYKGACIIRMMEHFLGKETFRSGLQEYIIGNAYRVVTHDDLWAYLTE